MKKRRAYSRILCLVLLAAVLFSVSFIIAQSSHVCTGVNCPVCGEMRLCIANIADPLAAAAVLLSLVLLPPLILAGRRTREAAGRRGLTPVTLRDKLSD